MARGRSRMAAAVSVAVVLALPATAVAGIRQAGSVLPPGQSGFVPPSGDQSASPHLSDQVALFESFGLKPATFDQPGAVETPRAGVVITRDAYGVPAVRAGSQNDAWFGAGYAVAQDRLVELELFRRQTEGRLAEILGKSRLAGDVVARRDYYTKAELRKLLRGVPASLRARFDAYAAGVNAWLARVAADPSLRPQEFALLNLRPGRWTALDSVAIGVQLARTVPSDDGRELQNWRALRTLGARRFARFLPLRQPGAPVTVPASEGKFPSQPGRTRRDEKRGFAASRKFLAKRKPPKVRATTSAARTASASAPAAAGIGAAGLPAHGGSLHFALRAPGRSSLLFSGPQLGFSIPELFVELEVHAPGLDVRGATAPGIPVIAVGHNGHLAWGITSGLDDDDDLYVERLAGRERYRYKGKTRRMSCRTEAFKVSGAKTTKRRFCRTVHGPVQIRQGTRVAYARRYAIFKHELGTLRGLADLNAASSVQGAGAAARRLTWNENLLVADDGGHIGWWHPGRLPLRPRRWDERLPLPGTGQAEWRGVLPFKALPKVIDPAQGWIANWNNMPSAGWTNGDAPAPERNEFGLNRAAYLFRLVRVAHANPTYETLRVVERDAGTHAQQRVLLDGRLRAAQAAADGPGRALLDAIVAWDGDYDRQDAAGTVDPGVAAFEALKDALERRELPPAAIDWLGQRGSSHPFDAGAAEVAALRAVKTPGLVAAAGDAADALQRRFGTADPAGWREPRRTYPVTAQGLATPPRIEFFDRGTFSQAVELGP